MGKLPQQTTSVNTGVFSITELQYLKDRGQWSGGIDTNNLAFWVDPSNPNCYSGSGTTITNIGSVSLTGTLTNGASVVTSSGITYFNLDGTDDYITFGNSSINQLYQNFTVWGYVYVSGTSGWSGLLSAAVSSPVYDGWSLEINSSGNQIDLIGLNNGSYSRNSVETDNYNFNEWNLFIATISGSTIKVYKNGGTQSGNSDTFTIRGQTQGMSIGRFWHDQNNYYRAMRVGQVGVYTRVLTTSELNDLYAATKGSYGL